MIREPGPAVDLDQKLGQVDLRQARLDQLPQPSVVDRIDGRIVHEEAVLGELRLAAGVAFTGEPFEQVGLLGGEHAESLGAVDGELDRLGEGVPHSLPLLVGEQEAGRVAVSRLPGTQTRPARSAERSSYAAHSS